MALPAERSRYDQTAEACDKDLSAWIRDVLNAEADRVAASTAPQPVSPSKKKRLSQ